MKPTDKIFCNTFGTHFQMYYKMRILPVIFLFSMMTKAQDKVVLGFLIHGVNLILNKGMTGIWIARRYWLFFYIEEPIYPSVYHVFLGGGKTISYNNLLFLLLVRILFQLFLNFSSMINLILVTFLPVLIGSNSMFISVNSLISNCAFSKTFLRKSGKRL